MQLIISEGFVISINNSLYIKEHLIFNLISRKFNSEKKSVDFGRDLVLES